MLDMESVMAPHSRCDADRGLHDHDHETEEIGHDPNHPDRRRFAYRPGAALTMPEGPRGEQRPADAIGRAVRVARIATGEIEEALDRPRQSNKAKGGRVGGAARAAALSPTRRSEIARNAAEARWTAKRSDA